MKHTCIRPACGNTYEDNDVDAYYCPTCNEQRKIIAAEIDKKLAGKVATNIKSPLQQYDEAQKVRGFVDARIFLG